MLVPGPALIELTVVSNAGKKLYALAEEEGWPSHILTPLYLGITQIEDEMTGETVMPVPEGELTDSQIWTTPEVIEEELPEEDEDDLPELS